MDAQLSPVKDLRTEKGFLPLQSSPGPHLSPHRLCLERTVPHRCLGVRGNDGGGNGGRGGIEKVLLEGGR